MHVCQVLILCLALTLHLGSLNSSKILNEYLRTCAFLGIFQYSLGTVTLKASFNLIYAVGPREHHHKQGPDVI